jgi:hypothetical protein
MRQLKCTLPYALTRNSVISAGIIPASRTSSPKTTVPAAISSMPRSATLPMALPCPMNDRIPAAAPIRISTTLRIVGK